MSKTADIDYGILNTDNRTAWLEQTLSKVPKGWKILDAGAGECQYRRFCGHLEYVSQDFAQYDGVGDGHGLQMGAWNSSQIDIVGDITNIPVPDASFDAVMCTEVFEHLPAPIEALREFSRIVRPGGKLILSAPFASLTHFAPYHFYSGFSRYFYERHLADNGFEIEELTPNGSYFEYVAQELQRLPDMVNRYARGGLRRYEHWARAVMLAFLRRMMSRDKGSAEAMCFGYHVVAKRL